MRISEATLRGWRRFACFGLAVLLTGAAHARMDTAARIELGEDFVPDPQHARLTALGFDALVADFYWLQAVQLVGGEYGRTEQHAPLIGRLIDVVTSVDPWVDHPYRFAALWLTDSALSVQHANRLLERGIAYHPQEWRNRHYLGFNHFFYLGDSERAAEILETAVDLVRAPTYLGRLVARLRFHAGSEQGDLATTAVMLSEMARSTTNEYARADYLKALDEIEVERQARFLDAARSEYRRRNGRDIGRVEDLLAGPHAVLPQLPAAHVHFADFGWVVDPETGRIVSSFYKRRYRLHSLPSDEARRERWRTEHATEASAG